MLAVSNFGVEIQSLSWAWWCTPVTSALERLWQEDLEFKASRGYIARSCLNNNTVTKKFLSFLKDPNLSLAMFLKLKFLFSGVECVCII
jgi:hypothetical protein